MRHPKLTVIMSNYNQARYVGQAIESVLAQKTSFPFCLLITDDHSLKDNSLEIVRAYAQKYPNIIRVLENKENGRYLQNILRAKAQTKTPYFTLLDADDYWTDDAYLQKAVDFLEKNKDFSIYYTNVTTLRENGSSRLYVQTKLKTADFTFDDFLHDKIFFSQTTGMVFRNTIYRNGIPDIVQHAVGTDAERSFEGDADRFIMHLHSGKAHFVNESSGVYRLLSGGIWTGLNDFEKAAIQARCFMDYDRYFDGRYHQFFIGKAWKEICHCLSCLNQAKENQSFCLEAREKFFDVLTICLNHKKEINLILHPQLKKLKYRLIKKIYDWAAYKLRKKGII